MEKIGGSISFQLIDIFNIIEDKTLSEEQKKKNIEENNDISNNENINQDNIPKRKRNINR